MSYPKRLILIILLAIGFIILTPYIILKATGHRFYWQKKILVPTGSLFVTTQPNGARIFLDGQLQPKKNLFSFDIFWRLLGKTNYGGETPSLINNLLPGNYLLQIKKDNFQTWEKRIGILPRSTLELRDIKLFYTDPRITLLDENEGLDFWPSPSKRHLLYSDQNGLKLIEEEKITNLITTTDPIFVALWNNNGDKIIAQLKKDLGGQNVYLFDLKTGDKFNLTEKIFEKSSPVLHFKWDVNDNDSLTVLMGNTIYQVDWKNNQITKLYKSSYPILNWAVEKNILEILSQKGEQTWWEQFDLNQKNKQTKYSTNLGAGAYNFFPEKIAPLTTLLMGPKQKNWLINYQNEKIRLTSFEGQLIHLPVNSGKMIFLAPYELRAISINGNQKKLEESNEKVLIRFSDRPEYCLMLDDFTVIFNLKNNIFSLDFRNQKFQNQFLILTTDKINFLSSYQKSSFILSGTINNQSGLFLINIAP